jgi:Peptidoglycan-binding protein, CsiV
MKRTILLCISLLISLFCLFAKAEDGKYQIELLLFSQGLPTTEVFDQTASLIQWPTALAELSTYQQTDNRVLKAGAAALFKNPAYQLIGHFSWQQSPGIGSVILPVHIQSADGKLDGYLQLRNAQPFELVVDLEQKSAQTDQTGKPYIYRLTEKRPIKLNEIQYFDHPKLGLLILVN